MNTIVNKPWGTYQVLDQGNNYLTKKIYVKPKGKLSLQSHNHRSEHWIVVEGIAEVIIDEKIVNLDPNQSIFIEKKTKHISINVISLYKIDPAINEIYVIPANNLVKKLFITYY